MGPMGWRVRGPGAVGIGWSATGAFRTFRPATMPAPNATRNPRMTTNFVITLLPFSRPGNVVVGHGQVVGDPLCDLNHLGCALAALGGGHDGGGLPRGACGDVAAGLR